MSKFKLHLDKKQYDSKPTGQEISKKVIGINDRITGATAEVTAAELANAVGNNGQTMVLATMNGKRSKLNMIQQQVLALDFDNSYTVKDKNGKDILKKNSSGKLEKIKMKTEGFMYQTIEDTLEDPFIKENAAFIYKTFSHTDEWEKFRVVFVLDEPMTTSEQVTGAYKHLMKLYPNADKSTKDSSRLFFGGTEATEINFENTLEIDSLPVDEKVVYKEQSTNDAKAPNVKPIVEAGETPTWLLIKQGKKEEVKERLSVYGNITLPDDMACIQYLKTIPMADMLGIKSNPFNDIFTNDQNPSASIWKPEDSNTWIYSQLNNPTATGAPKSYNVIQVVQTLLSSHGNQYPYGLAIDYLLEATGITIHVTEEIAEIRKAADRFKEVLLSDAFKMEHPEMYQIFGRYNYTNHINSVIDIYKMNLYMDDESGQIKLLTRMTEENMAKRLGVTKDKANHLMTLMSFTHITDKLSDSAIPKNLLKEIEHNRTHYWDSTKRQWMKREKAREYRTNIIALNNLMENFNEIEERCDVLVNYGFNRKTQNREFALIALGKAEADRLFPQDTERKVSKKTEAFEAAMVKYTMKAINKDNYISTKKLKDAMQRKWKSKGYTDRKYSQILGSMLEAYELEKVPLTNVLVEELNVKGMSTIGGPQILKRKALNKAM